MAHELVLQTLSGRLLLEGQKVRYTGSPMGILGMWLRVWFFSVITLSIYWWLRGKGAVGRYMDAHLEWADMESRLLESSSSTVLSGERPIWRIRMADTGIGMLVTKLLVWLGLAITAGLAYPWLMNWYFGRWAGRLLFDGRTVRYTGSPSGILGMWLRVWFFSIITLSIYWWLRGKGAVGRYMDAHLQWADIESRVVESTSAQEVVEQEPQPTPTAQPATLASDTDGSEPMFAIQAQGMDAQFRANSSFDTIDFGEMRGRDFASQVTGMALPDFDSDDEVCPPNVFFSRDGVQLILSLETTDIWAAVDPPEGMTERVAVTDLAQWLESGIAYALLSNPDAASPGGVGGADVTRGMSSTDVAQAIASADDTGDLD